MLGNALLRFIVGYIKAALLTVVVLPTIIMLIFIWSSTTDTMYMGWIRYFSFIQPELATGNVTLNGNDVMQIFAVISFAIFVLIELIKLCGVRIPQSPKYGSILIGGVYFCAIFMALYVQKLDMTFLVFFFGMGVISMTAFLVWYKLTTIKL